MASKNDLIEIRMKLLGAREVAEGTGLAKKGIKGVGEATRGTSRESTKAAKANSVLTRSYGALGKAVKYGIGILGVTGVFALQQAVTNTEELAKTTTGLNRNLGLSVKVGSEWAAVAHARGIASTALNMGFTKLGRSFVEANRKGGTARTALNQLGITQAQTEKGAKDFSYALDLVADKFGAAKAGPQRQAAAMALLGKGYSTVLPLFASGSKGLQEQLKWADKYGVTLDGKTNDALMDMVNAQRESKVAMLGLQVTLTKALMPAIEGGEEQLQKFIAVLNDDDLTRTEKITHIQKMFENLEDTLIEVITEALPKVAEGGGKLGIALAGAVWTGFKNSDALGKFVISAWLLKYMGGGALIATVAGKAGAAIGKGLMKALFPYLAAELAASGSLSNFLQYRFKSMGTLSGRAFAVGVVAGIFLLAAWIGVELAKRLPESTQRAIHNWGWNAGENFINALVDSINYGLDKANLLSFLGVDAPNLHHVDFSGHHMGAPVNGPTGPHGPTGGPQGRGRGAKGPPGPKGPTGKRDQTPRRDLSTLFNPRLQLFIDGKEVAIAVKRHADNAAATA